MDGLDPHDLEFGRRWFTQACANGFIVVLVLVALPISVADLVDAL
jgi:hypothetical protein